MGEHRIVYENRHFGRYLRRIREDRKLSLDAVEEMTLGYPEPVTKSHLSRIENGRAVPTFPRMFALSQIYGVPISSMAERFESDLRNVDASLVDVEFSDLEALFARLEELRLEGRYDVMLKLVEATIDHHQALYDNEQAQRLAIWQLVAMMKLGYYESGKVRCEELLGALPEDSESYLRTLVAFVTCSYRLGRMKVAWMGLEQLHQRLESASWNDDLRALVQATAGTVHHALSQYPEAANAFEAAMKHYAAVENRFETCSARINLSQTLISQRKFGQAIRHLNIAVSEASAQRYSRLIALGSGHLALAHFEEGDLDSSESYALRSNTIARAQDWKSMIFRNCYYLWMIASRRSDAKSLATNERTLRALLNRIPNDFPEVDEFRRFVKGGDQ